MAGHRFFFLAFAGLFLCFSLAHADTVPSTTPIYNNSTSSDPTDPDNCSTKHSGDYYGIGVRLGIYLVWLQSYLANTFLPDEISGALDANTIFMLALLAAIFRGTLIKGAEKMVKIDGLVLMQLSAGYIFGCLSFWGYRTVHYQQEGPRGIQNFGGIGTHSRLALACAISAYGVWFWSIGVLTDRGLAPLTDPYGNRRGECYPLKTFFFAKLDVLGGIRYWYILISSGCTIYYGIMLAVGGVERLMYLFQKNTSQAPDPAVMYQTGLNGKELDYVFTFLRVGNFIWMIFSVLMVELTLNWNKVKDVVGPGGQIAYPSQLLPVLIGALTLVRMIWLILRKRAWRTDGDAKTNEAGCDERSNEHLHEAVAGLGISAQEKDASRKPFYLRYLVAWLPWLSKFPIWTRQRGDPKFDSGAIGAVMDRKTSAGTKGANRDSMVPMMQKTPQSGTFPPTPFRDSYVSPALSQGEYGGSPASPLMTFSPEEK